MDANVYVIANNGSPLMPCSPRKARILLRDRKAVVCKRTPFTIKLLYNTTHYTQDIVLGIDAGSKTIGVSASTETKELYSAEVVLRNDIVDKLSARREYRRSRRNRKTRYRKPRFENRCKKDGWLAPSVQNKVETHLKVIADIHKILPISKIVVETASFDIQKLKNPDISGTEYQQGKQLSFWNVREYVLCRDGHICQHCHGKSKDKILNVHHIESRKTGGDAPNNLVTLCETCHKAYHAGKIELDLKRGDSFRDAAFMGIMRWALYERLKMSYPNVQMTFGYITKHTRISHGLPKSHRIDALCIAGHPSAEKAGEYYYQKRVRSHNRQLHKATPKKGGIRKANQSPKQVNGYRLFDKVRYHGTECFIFGRRKSGYFDIRLLDGTKIHAGISSKKLCLIERSTTMLTERKVNDAFPLMTEVTSLYA